MGVSQAEGCPAHFCLVHGSHRLQRAVRPRNSGQEGQNCLGNTAERSVGRPSDTQDK